MVRVGLRALLALAILAALGGIRGGQAVQPAGVAQSPGDNIGWDGRFGELGARSHGGAVRELATGPAGEIYAIGDFGWIGAAPTDAISPAVGLVARWVGGEWSVIGGADHHIQALYVDESGVYIAGYFSQVNGVAAAQVAHWDGSAWSSVGGGLDPATYGFGGFKSIARWNGQLYLAGDLGTDSDANMYRWNGNAWHGMSAAPEAMRYLNVIAAGPDGLYAGGSFSSFNGVSARNIARWDGSAWRAVGAGVAMEVRDIVAAGQSVYVAGFGDAPGGGLMGWSGGIWETLGAGLPQHMSQVAASGVDLYVSSSASEQTSAVWQRGPSGWLSAGGSDNAILALAASGFMVVAGGSFASIGGADAVNLAFRVDDTWQSGDGAGERGIIRAFAGAQAALYAGGSFDRVGAVRAGNIAAWDGVGWAPLGGGLDGRVGALAVKGSLLYAGGAFSRAGGAPAANIAVWNGSSWAPLSEGVSSESGGLAAVTALAVAGDSLYVGGRFSHAGGVPARNLARWDGQSWSAVGGGVSGDVADLAWDGANLYVGGTFTQAGSQQINHLARWDGQSWSGLGANLHETGAVYALAWDRGQLYVGGRFLGIGGLFGFRVARWDGQRWHAMGVGSSTSSEYIGELAVSNGAVYAGGQFSELLNGDVANPSGVTAVPARGVARWDGQRWEELGAGVNSEVYAIAPFGRGIYVGGRMGIAGGKVSLGIARWEPPLRTYLPLARRMSR